MRLTLRTLLAYMDDILDPADHEELARKIETSEFATELIHRSRDSVRRLRLGAPDPLADDSADVLGGDANWDANTVAEYLDNTLAPEGVAEFEKQCLEQGPESDMLLAETTSCHHILTMVLGEPAEVDVDVRQRLYRMGAVGEPVEADATAVGEGAKARIEPAHLMGQAPTADSTSDAKPPFASPEPEVATTEDHVPDYLRAAAAHDKSRRRYVVLAALIVIAAGMAFAFWPPSATEQSPGGDSEMAQSSGSVAGVSEDASQADAESDALPSDDATSGDGPAVGQTEAQAAADRPSSDGPSLEEGDPVEPRDVDSEAASPTPMTPPELPTNEPADGADASQVANAELPQEEPSPQDDAFTETETDAIAFDEETLGDDGFEDMLALDPANIQSPDAISPPMEPWEGSAADGGSLDETSNEAPRSFEAALDPLDSDQPPLDVSSGASGDVGNAAALSTSPGVPPLPEPLNDAGPPATTTNEEPMTADLLPDGDEATDPLVESGEPRVIGNYLGNGDVLLLQDLNRNAWVRLPMGSPLTEGDRLLALPTMRAHAVIQDMNVFLGGGTSLILGPPGSEESASSAGVAMRLRRGRVLINAGLGGNRFVLFVGGHQYEVEMQPSSSLAVELRLTYLPASLDSTDAPEESVQWHATSGSVAVVGPQGKQEADGPSTWTTEGKEEVSSVNIVGRLPAWISGEPVTDLERNARDQITEALNPGEEVEITLLEFADKSSRGRRRENRTVATACCAYIGQFEPFVRAISDSDLRAYWDDLLATVRETLAVDPSYVEELQGAFKSLRGEAAASDLVEMTLGYDLGPLAEEPTQQQLGILRQLVRWMDDDQLDYRVLALHNINQLTGVEGRGGYRPWHNTTERSRSLRHYQDLDDLWALVRANAPPNRE